MKKNNKIIVTVNNVNKTYRLYSSHLDRVREALDPFRKRYYKEFSALNDVSFDIYSGQSIGVLGRNGSGKSTLLQLIAGVIKPTSGTVNVQGKVSALLELGAGFNPDLTGRENVILSNTIQGFSDCEIKERVAEVETFADIGIFFDQPLKVYSSGMYARVAFANAINVNPDILIIDEILGVGDSKFQEKCYHKIRLLKEAGVCIIFVSHSTEVIQRNCDFALLLEDGKLLKYGETSEIVASYNNLLYGSHIGDLSVQTYSPSIIQGAVDCCTAEGGALSKFIGTNEKTYYRHNYYNSYERRIGNGDAEIIDFLLLVNDKSKFDILDGNEKLKIYIKVKFNKANVLPQLGWALVSTEGLIIAGSNTVMQKTKLPRVEDCYVFIYVKEISLTALQGGQYFLDVGVGQYENYEWTYFDLRNSMIHIEVRDSGRGSGFFCMESSCRMLENEVLN